MSGIAFACLLLLVACDSAKEKSVGDKSAAEPSTEQAPAKAPDEGKAEATKPSLPEVKDASWADLCKREHGETVAPPLSAEAAVAHVKSKLGSDDPALTALVAQLSKLPLEHQAPRFRAEAVRAGQETCSVIDYLELVYLTSACSYEGDPESCMRSAFHSEARGASKKELQADFELACAHGVAEGCVKRAAQGKKSKWLGRACNRGRSCEAIGEGHTEHMASITTPIDDKAVAARFLRSYIFGVKDCWRETSRSPGHELTLSFELVGGRPTKVSATSKTKAFNTCLEKTVPLWAFGAEAAKGPHEMVLDLTGYGWLETEAEAAVNKEVVLPVLTGSPEPEHMEHLEQEASLDRAIRDVKRSAK